MLIIVPTNDRKGLSAEVAEHFGRCRTYTLINEQGNVIKVVDNTSEHMGGKGLPPEIMREHKAEVLLCRGLGLRALKLCSQFNIKVYVSQADNVKEVFNLWKSKKLSIAGCNDACKEH
ncbi:MAG: NifB/NifX family molybdenum-iron cluster-binding protein [Nanoarchaeota archaeon]|nr:NifB/NifX family molybdenum-iron cluster-binding protein [Nanoarchaeota archaeon]